MFFVRTSVISVPDFAPSEKSATFKPNNEMSVVRDQEDARRFQVKMHTTMNLEMSADFQYAIDFECLAFLTSDGTLSEEEARRAAAISGHNVLYGAIREAIASTTGRHPHGTLVLGFSVLPTRKDPAVKSSKEIAE
jgi:hypothetical protein